MLRCIYVGWMDVGLLFVGWMDVLEPNVVPRQALNPHLRAANFLPAVNLRQGMEVLTKAGF